MVFKALIAFAATAQLAFGATADPGVLSDIPSSSTSRNAAQTQPQYNPNYANSFAETSWPQNPAIRYPGSPFGPSTSFGVSSGVSTPFFGGNFGVPAQIGGYSIGQSLYSQPWQIGSTLVSPQRYGPTAYTAYGSTEQPLYPPQIGSAYVSPYTQPYSQMAQQPIAAFVQPTNVQLQVGAQVQVPTQATPISLQQVPAGFVNSNVPQTQTAFGQR